MRGDQPPRDRIVQLDALRGVAAIWVMLYHYTIQYAGEYGHGPGVWRVAFGQRAVELFFMISGFVIPMTLGRTKRAGDFAVSRFSRLYPTFWACLAITTILTAVVGLPGAALSPAIVAANFSMGSRLFFHLPYVDQSYWTLEVELLFYVLTFVGWRAGGMRGVFFMIAGLVLFALGEDVAGRFGHRSPSGLVDSLLLRAFIAHFAFGLAAYLLRDGVTRARGATLLAVALLAIVLRDGLASSCVTIGLVAALMLASIDGFPGLSWRPILFVGSISYPLYLLHQNLGYVVIRRGYAAGLPPDVNIVLAVAVSVGLAVVVSFCVERPAMRWIRAAYTRLRPIPVTGSPRSS